LILKIANILGAILCWFFFGTFGFIYGQPYSHYGTKEGLASNYAYRTIQDDRGFLWITTANGISRFNGKEFKNFGLQNGLPIYDIWMLLPDDGKLWFFGRSNRLGYVKADSVETFENEKKIVFHPSKYYKTSGLTGFASLSNVFLKYFYFDDKQWKELSPPRDKAILIDLKKKRWLIAVGDSLQVIDSQSKLQKTIDKPAIAKAIFFDVNQINDSISVFLTPKSVHFLNLINLAFTDYFIDTPIQTLRVNFFNQQIQISSKQFLWIFDLNFKLLEKIKVPDTINADFVFLDKDENLWLTSLTQGLFFIPRRDRHTQCLFKNQKIRKLVRYQSHIFAKTEPGGYFEIDPITYSTKKWLDWKNFGVLKNLENLDALLISNDDEILLIKGSQTQKITKQPHFLNATQLSFYEKKWLNVGNGNYWLNEDFSQGEKLPFDGARLSATTNEYLYTGGILGLKIYRNKTFTTPENNEHLASTPVTALTQLDASTLLVGTDHKGVYTAKGKKLDLVSTLDSLPVKDLFVENPDKFWVLSEGCIFKYIKSPETDKWKKIFSLCKPFKLFDEEINTLAVWNNQLYLGTNNGLVIYRLEDLTPSPSKSLYIKHIELDGISVSQNKLTFKATSQLQLNLSLGYIDYLNDEAPVFNYRLLPAMDWRSSKTGEITLVGLSPNKYTLEIKDPGNEQHSLKLQFDIVPLWWQTWWFRLSVLFLIFGFAGWLVYLYLNKKNHLKNKRLEERRKQIESELHALRAQMNPHFIFNSLNAIQYYLNEKGPELSEKYLMLFSKLIRMIFEFTGKKTISLEQEIAMLKNYLELEKMRFGEHFYFIFDIDNRLDTKSTFIPTMILQPLVENAVNHGIFHKPEGGTIVIKYDYVLPTLYRIFIIDDGIGIQKSKEIKSKSILIHPTTSSDILKERIELINKVGLFNIQCKIEDNSVNNETGTKITLNIRHGLYEKPNGHIDRRRKVSLGNAGN